MARLADGCELCGRDIVHGKERGKDAAVIDHDHDTGEARTVLCGACNVIEEQARKAAATDL